MFFGSTSPNRGLHHEAEDLGKDDLGDIACRRALPQQSGLAPLDSHIGETGTERQIELLHGLAQPLVALRLAPAKQRDAFEVVAFARGEVGDRLCDPLDEQVRRRRRRLEDGLDPLPQAVQGGRHGRENELLLARIVGIDRPGREPRCSDDVIHRRRLQPLLLEAEPGGFEDLSPAGGTLFVGYLRHHHLIKRTTVLYKDSPLH